MPASRSSTTKHVRNRHTGAGETARRRSLIQMMREAWRAFRHDHPGGRFRNHYHRLRDHGSTKLRVMSIVAGVLLIAGGVVLLFLPGPGLLLLVFGLALLAGESRFLAGRLDRAELWVRPRLARIRRRWQQLRSRFRRS